MPGTIQVSVLGFKGIQTSSASSNTSIKVSMGKREYHTWEEGDFAFPLTTLRDNLILRLIDENGTEISHTGVETRLIIEKGVLEETFAFEGVGNVRLKLRFVLSDEDRERIRVVRQSALRKKHEELISRHVRTAKTSNPGQSLSLSSGVSDSETNRSKIVVAGEARQGTTAVLSSERKLDSGKLFRNNLTDRKHENSSAATQTSQLLTSDLPEVSHEDAESSSDVSARNELSEVTAQSEIISFLREDIGLSKQEETQTDQLEKQSPETKTPSNVRKMISNFESGVTKVKKPRSAKTGTDSSIGSSGSTEEVDIKKGNLRLQASEKMKVKADIGFVKPAVSSQNSVNLKELREENVQTKREITIFKNMSDNMKKEFNTELDERLKLQKSRAPGLSTSELQERKHKSNSSANPSQKQGLIIEEKEKGACSEDSSSVHIPRASNSELKNSVCRDSENWNVRSSRLWIFPEDASICVTSCGKRETNLVEDNMYQKKMNPCVTRNTKENNVHGEAKVNDCWKHFQKLSKPKPENSADPEEPRGPTGQVMRAVIMVGFAALVLLTRQRNGR